MAEHTPGPWAVIPPNEDCRTWFIARDRLGAPIGVCPEHIDDGLPYYIAVFGVLMEPERAEANARLITAAPDLLAIVERLVEIGELANEEYDRLEPQAHLFSMVERLQRLDDEAVAAIAKAKGK